MAMAAHAARPKFVGTNRCTSTTLIAREWAVACAEAARGHLASGPRMRARRWLAVRERAAAIGWFWLEPSSDAGPSLRNPLKALRDIRHTP